MLPGEDRRRSMLDCYDGSSNAAARSNNRDGAPTPLGRKEEDRDRDAGEDLVPVSQSQLFINQLTSSSREEEGDILDVRS